jgi:hypothetical protein
MKKKLMLLTAASLMSLAFIAAQASAYTTVETGCQVCHPMSGWTYGTAWHTNHYVEALNDCLLCHTSYPDYKLVPTAACSTCHDKCKSVNDHEVMTSCLVCHSECDSTLAEFASLKAFSLLKRVVLQWETIVEMDNVAFEIQSSTDGENYETIATVPSKADNMGAASYTYVDKPSVSGTVSYKVVDIDTTGKKTEHGPIEVNVR